MLTATTFNELLENNKTLILDGALASELENRGHDLNHPLWSGLILRDSPADITKLHRDYFLSGANVAITASYQTSTQGLTEHFNLSELEAKNFISQSVRLAQHARDEATAAIAATTDNAATAPSNLHKSSQCMLIAGSVGPYGAYLANGAEYTGLYGSDISQQSLKDFHRPRIEALVSAGVDLLAIETLPHFGEVEAVLDLLASEFPDTVAWVSCTLRDSRRISDGTALENVLKAVVRHNRDRVRNGMAAQVVAFGFNCVEPVFALQACELLAELQAREPELAMPLVCYPNSGENWDGERKLWIDGERANGMQTAELAEKLRDAGVRLIGGCCRTGPKYVEEIAAAVG